MREIKFRAWDKKTKKMIFEGFHVVGEVACFQLIDQYCHEHKDKKQATLERMNDIEIMQFTGLKDKNGKEIYEGDIVKTHFADHDLVGVIKYADKWAKFYFAAKNPHGVGVAFDPESVFYWYYAEEDEENTSICEVIGNIYENPDLIEDNT